MDAILTTLGPAFGAEALKLWGSYAFIFIVLIWTLRRADQRLQAKEAENATLRDKLDALQEQRVKDAEHLIDLAEIGNARMVSRYSGDQKLTESMGAMALAIQDLRMRMPPDKANG